MRILHIAPMIPYNEGWSYQENLLPKYQQAMGHEVCLVVTNREHHGNKLIEVQCDDRITRDGFRVVRRKVNATRIKPLLNTLSTIDVSDILLEFRPDFVHYHGLSTMTMRQVIAYKKKYAKDLIIVQDNHLDYNIGFNPYTIKGRILRIIESGLQKQFNRYVSRIYGVTPWRKKYAIEVLGAPANKTDVLIMGADDEKINFENREAIRKRIRKENSVSDCEFMIVTGGRIDEKKKIHLLMQAVNQMEGVRLIVFGNILDDIEREFRTQLSDKVRWIGFINADKTYDYFLAADLVMFPGQHSVLWEQACACKVPCLVKRWEGMEHVNNGGNCGFLDDTSVDGLKKAIQELIFTEKYNRMLEVAQSNATDIFLYSKIAEKSLECVNPK